MPKSRISGRSSKIYIYIAERKAKGVTESAPSKRCWFDCIDQILASIAKADNLPRGGREGKMGIPIGNLHQNIEEANHHTEPECEEILPRGDMSSPIRTTPMFIDGTHVEASPSSPCTSACCQQGVDGKPISKKMS
jgi:hypothetical protein